MYRDQFGQFVCGYWGLSLALPGGATYAEQVEM